MHVARSEANVEGGRFRNEKKKGSKKDVDRGEDDKLLIIEYIEYERALSLETIEVVRYTII